jgi:hypothetical protein
MYLCKKRDTMNNDTTIHSSLYEVTPIDFPQGEEYISDIELITMSDTGIIDAQVANMTLNESCIMLINAIRVFTMGFFDCAFYSLRQTIELSIGGIRLFNDSKKIKDWNNGEKGFEKGRMVQFLEKNDATFGNVKENLKFYFDDLLDTERKIDKYVHKQGVNTFYTYHGHTSNYQQKHKTKILEDFEKYLTSCIGAVAIYRLIIDPLPLLLTDQEIAMRSPAFVTEPYGQSFINKYIGSQVVESYKQTDIYQGYYKELMSREKQNEAIYNIIHYQYINRKSYNDYWEQIHLLSAHDLLALIISLSSTKISYCYLMDGYSWYTTDVQPQYLEKTIELGKNYFEQFFKDNTTNYNQTYKNNYISMCTAYGETHYFEHNEPLADQEIAFIENASHKLDQKYEETNKKLQDWYNEQIKQHHSPEWC